jgi:putative nucleotidyltransferase with HDIG domain
MYSSMVQLHGMTQLAQEIDLQLAAIDSLRLSDESLHQVRLIQLRRLARQIEAPFPQHVGHGVRTAYYALRLAGAIGLAKKQLTDLHYAALLHDIGLLALPAGLLDKATPLTLDEYALIQSHPRKGAAMLSHYPFLSESARWIAHHHERWDGAGYPFGLRGIDIPLSARILAIADAFDAIAGRSQSLDMARRSLCASSGTQFDPALLETFSVLLDDETKRPSAFESLDGAIETAGRIRAPQPTDASEPRR